MIYVVIDIIHTIQIHMYLEPQGFICRVPVEMHQETATCRQAHTHTHTPAICICLCMFRPVICMYFVWYKYITYICICMYVRVRACVRACVRPHQSSWNKRKKEKFPGFLKKRENRKKLGWGQPTLTIILPTAEEKSFN